MQGQQHRMQSICFAKEEAERGGKGKYLLVYWPVLCGKTNVSVGVMRSFSLHSYTPRAQS